jgi:hypothetical protein
MTSIIVEVKIFIFVLIRIVVGGAHSGSTLLLSHFWLFVLAPDDCQNGEFGGMKIGRGNQGIRRKPAPAPLCPPQRFITILTKLIC